jgi:NAD(P)-dependent dehydrogenase (short-subunit alcohol dehydrogenase family)
VTSSRAVLVTGGSRGIGRTIARAFAECGDRVAVHFGSSRELAEEVVAGLPGSGHALVQADMADAAAVGAMVDDAAGALGGLDVLVNNAGIAAGGRIELLDAAHWQRVLGVNVLGAVTGCRTFTPLFKAQGRGHIVNVASVAGLVHPPAMSSYDAGKAAVVALSESLRHELAPWGIDVSVVCPSFFRSDLAASLSGEDPVMDAAATRLITGAPLGADEIAERVLRAVDARRFLVLPDRSARLAFWAKRLARPLYDRQMLGMGARIRRAEQDGDR